ncbi:hypothetical protein RBH26_21175, partial [Natronolimnohabitans sp. A-GB9]|uniref:hypothetical protein n=1 Tax=Natronolimnohabitans sp. A-GB9 TaxID=3069757 RepID=UPI0027B75225
YENEREEKGYSDSSESKEEKVKQITDKMGGAWSDPSDPVDELAEEVIERIEGETVAELDSRSQVEEEANAEELEQSEEPSPEAKRQAAKAFQDRGGVWSDIGNEIEEELSQEEEQEEKSVNVVFEELSQGEKKELDDGRVCAIDPHLAKFGEDLAMVQECHYKNGDKIIYTPFFN